MDAHIDSMAKPSNRDRILTEGLRVVHERGYAGASVRDIVQAAGVPQGSFTNHFASKEAFALEVIGLYLASSREAVQATLLDDTLPPRQRLAAYIDRVQSKVSQNGVGAGCLFGNFSAEASCHSEVIRARLVEVFAELQAAIAGCLEDAVRTGEAAPDLDCAELAGFLVASIQGAHLLGKAQRSTAPLQRLKHVLLTRLLVRPSDEDVRS